MELVSVIMSTYNEKFKWVKQAIDSIIHQTWEKIEFIIVLDNPKNTQLCIKVEEYTQKFENVILIKNEKNLGLPCSLNKAIDYCSGKFIARMDADDISFSNRIEAELEYLVNNHFDMVASSRIDIDEGGNEISSIKKVPQNRQVNKLLPHICYITHPSVIIRADIIKKVGGYRNITSCEDYDLWLRLLSSNYRIGIIENPLIFYRIRSTSIGKTNNLYQRIMTEYVQKLYHERIKNNDSDSFSESHIQQYLIKHKYFNQKVKKQYELAYQQMERGCLLLRQKKRLIGLCYLVISTKDKHIRKQIFDLIYYHINLQLFLIKSSDKG